MSSNDLITGLSFVVPTIVVAGFAIWFRTSMDRAQLSGLFLEVFTLFAAGMVLFGAFVPRYFAELGDNKPFLIVVCLSAVLHALSSVASAISAAKSRSQAEPDSRLFDKRN